MDIKVVKFGGSSLADAKQFEKVAAIIKADPARRYVVPSAPGKRFSGDDKVTDLLYQCYDHASKGEDIDAEFDKIVERYNNIIRDLNLDFSLEKGESVSSAILSVGKQGYLLDHLMNTQFSHLQNKVTFTGWERADGLSLYEPIYNDIVLNACTELQPGATFNVKAKDLECPVFKSASREEGRLHAPRFLFPSSIWSLFIV